MNTPTIDLMYRHFSVRSYTPKAVSKEMIEAIVAAGQRASTSSNLQTYSVVVVIEDEKRARLAELCAKQAFIYQAPVFMAWCADLSRLERVCQARGYQIAADYLEPFLVASVDVALAMQNAALAAQSLGLGMCYIGGIRNSPVEIIELLDLPPLVFPLVGMTLGWPAVEPFIRPRLPLRTILHWEQYDTTDEVQALGEYDQAMIATGIYEGRQVPIPGVDGEMEDYGWQEHSARRASKPTREFLREVLKARGFELK